MPIRALIFDFDGLILDTETPDYQAWQQVYHDHGVDLPLEKWASIVGGTAISKFDPYDYLEELLGRKLDREAIWIKRRRLYIETLESQPVLPGVQEYLDDARRLELKGGVASSSPEGWVAGHLTRLNLMDYFDCVCTADDVETTKPDPSLFQEVLTGLGVTPKEAIVFEDSPNGVMGAKRAGIFTVAVPNPLTAQLVLDEADLLLGSLSDMTLEQLLEEVKSRSGG